MTNREAYEGNLFTSTATITSSDTQTTMQKLWQQGSQAFFNQLFRLYRSTAYSTEYNRSSAIFGDAFINCGSGELATAFSKASLPVWK